MLTPGPHTLQHRCTACAFAFGVAVLLSASIRAAATGATSTSTSAATTTSGPTAPTPAPPIASSTHDFDFEFGNWRVHHRVKSPGDGTWKEFDGTCTTRPFMAGQGDIEEHIFFRPAGKTYGTAIRAFDPATHLWAIWWVDSRFPHFTMDPPAKGSFENGVGNLYSDSVVDGKTISARLTWSRITRTSAHWEQASSDDGGKTWDTNWYMDFTRVCESPNL